MKKYLGGICSILAGALMFVFMALPYQTQIGVLGSAPVSGYDWLNVQSATIKVFLIIGIVLASLCILFGIVSLLQKSGILKINFNTNIINAILVSLLAITVIIVFILIINDCNSNSAYKILSIEAKIAFGIIIQTIFAILVSVGSWFGAIDEK